MAKSARLILSAIQVSWILLSLHLPIQFADFMIRTQTKGRPTLNFFCYENQVMGSGARDGVALSMNRACGFQHLPLVQIGHQTMSYMAWERRIQDCFRLIPVNPLAAPTQRNRIMFVTKLLLLSYPLLHLHCDLMIGNPQVYCCVIRVEGSVTHSKGRNVASSCRARECLADYANKCSTFQRLPGQECSHPVLIMGQDLPFQS